MTKKKRDMSRAAVQQGAGRPKAAPAKPAAPVVADEEEDDAGRNRPNDKDPLSEPTRHRRIWAAYIKAGYTRAAWARALGTQYTSADRWDTGEVVMSLDKFWKAAELLSDHFTALELQYGRSGQPTEVSRFVDAPALSQRAQPYGHVQQETELTDEQIKQLLVELGADVEERRALSSLVAGPGRFDVLTESYVREYVLQERLLRERGMAPHARQLNAHTAALRAQAQTRVIASPPHKR